MTHYAGLDVSLEETAICVVDGTGRIVKEARAASEPAALVAALSKINVPLDRIGLEACSLTAWLHDELRAAGWPAICIETRQANAAMKTMPNKTDRNDARALAQIMRTGWYRQVHVKSRQCRLWRSLLVARRTVLNEMRSIETVVTGRSEPPKLTWIQARTRSLELPRGTERPCASDDRAHLDRAEIVARRTPPDDGEIRRSPWDGSFPMSIANHKRTTPSSVPRFLSVPAPERPCNG